MKYIILAAAIATRLAFAQDLDSLPACGQRCITNMLAKAEELGCSSADIPCLCLNEDFGNGIRDCTYESCPSNANKQSVLDVGSQFCAEALAQISAGSIILTATVTATTTGEDSDASVTTRSVTTRPVTITKTGPPVSTASVLVAVSTDSAGRNATSTIGGLVSGGVAITTTDSRGTTFITTATALPPASGNSTGSATRGTASPTGVRRTTTNSLGSTIVTTTTPSPTSSEESPSTDGAGSATGTPPAPTNTGAAVRLAAAGFAGFAGIAAAVLL